MDRQPIGARHRLLLAALGLLAACPPADDPVARDCEVPETATFTFAHDPITDRPLRWDDGAVVSVAVAEEGSKDLDVTGLLGPVEAAAAEWRDVSCVPPRLQLDAPAPAATFGFDRDGATQQSLLVWVSDEADWRSRHSESAVALTTLTTEPATGRILDADIELNDFSGYAWAVGGEGPVADVQTLVTHELGHLLGLGHDADPDALMASGWEPGLLRRELTGSDRAAVCTLYVCVPPPDAPASTP